MLVKYKSYVSGYKYEIREVSKGYCEIYRIGKIDFKVGSGSYGQCFSIVSNARMTADNFRVR